jgi:WD40 repeat protein
MKTKLLPAVSASRTAAIMAFFILVIAGKPICAQDWAKTNIEQLQRVDLRDLGYADVNQIPSNSSAITSLLTAASGKVYGATSGEKSYLFMFDPAINKVRHLGIISPGGVHHALAEGKDGCIYIGTGMNMLEPVPLTSGNPDETVDKTLWTDIRNHFNDYAGGHIYRYKTTADQKVKLPQMQCDLEDLGIPLGHNSVYALTINPGGNELYGITYPDGHFFIYNIPQRTFTDKGPVDNKIVFHGPDRDRRSLPGSLICDNSGKVYMTGTGGTIRYYDPATKELITTGRKIPGDYNYLQFYEDYAVVEYFAKSPSGLIYGGTSDGYLFSLSTDSMKLINLGKMRAARGLRCLTVGSDGLVYIMAGERSASTPCQLYIYNPNDHGFEDMGLLIADRSPYYYWRGQQFDAMTTGKDGTIYIGESERMSHLFLYIH